jgi:ATP-binding protein involved in chromosome partitioning
MVVKALEQLLGDVEWGALDFLVADFPPGTGDAQLTLTQKVPLSGAVIVTTPQDVALADVKRGISMFRKVNTPVLGVVQNMSTFVCPSCGTKDDLFGSRTGEQLAAELSLPLLADIPIDEAVRKSGDEGVPIVARDPNHPAARAFLDLAGRVRGAVDALADARANPEPVEITHDRENRIVRVAWSDGSTTEYTMKGLRGWCPCAECQGHSGERRFVDVRDPRLEAVEGVGRYAVRFLWEGGHQTGMYSYPYLREIADYPECRVR